MKKLLLALSILLIHSFALNASSLRMEMAELQNNPNHYKIVDAREKTLYSDGHLPNSINFPISLTYERATVDGKLTEPFKMQKIIQNLGLNVDDAIIVYDDGTFFDAARLFWTLEVYGFENVKLLNAGYSQWNKQKLQTSTLPPNIVKSDYVATIKHQRIATKFTTQLATRSPKQTIIDARPDKAYAGEVSSAKRFGHIPKAINIPASHNIDYDKELTELKDDETLTDVYKDVNKNQKVIIYCAVGRISSTNYFALRELGYDVANYDASWKEWGNDFSLPIVKESEK